jgi:hypothetical protein
MNEHVHVSAPGSRIDRANNAATALVPRQDAVDAYWGHLPPQETVTPVPIEGVARIDFGDTTIYRTLVLTSNSATATPAGWYALVLPQEPLRARAVILAIDNDIILCETKDLATNGNNIVATPPQPQGFYLSKGVSLEIKSNGLCYAVNTATTNTRVSVMIERYESP